MKKKEYLCREKKRSIPFKMKNLFSVAAILCRLAICLSAFLPVAEANSQPLFPCSSHLSDPYGVCTHITRPGWDYEIRQQELELTRQAGISWVRSDLDCGNFFSHRAQDTMPQSGCDPTIFDNVLATTEASGQQLLGILTWMGAYPWDDPYYSRLVEQLARTYDGRITHWEALNEVNLFRGVDSLCPKYIGTLRQTYETLKRFNPRNVVLSSGFAELPEPFIGDFSRLGGWRYCDVFNFHSYFAPEELIPCFQRLSGFMVRDGWSRPVWLTECGMHTAQEEVSSADFYSDLLPQALRRIGIREERAVVGVLRDRESGFNALSDDEADALLAPQCRRVVFCSFKDLEHLRVGDVPVLVASRGEYFPADRFPLLVDYVRRGGTIVLSGGMPFYYDAYTPDGTYFNRRETGTSLYPQLHMSAAGWGVKDPSTGEELTDTPGYWGRTSETSSSYEWKPTKASPARYFTDANLQPGDTLIPLVTAGSEHYRLPMAGIYRLGSDLRGNVVFHARMYAPAWVNREAEQARRVARICLLAFAYGVEKVFWYNLRSREKDLHYSEDCFGLIHHDFSEKPAMQAYRTLTSMLPSGSERPRLSLAVDGVYYATWLRPDGSRVHALWSPMGRVEVAVPATRLSAASDHLGRPLPLPRRRLTVGSGVTYLVEKKSKT